MIHWPAPQVRSVENPGRSLEVDLFLDEIDLPQRPLGEAFLFVLIGIVGKKLFIPLPHGGL